MDISVGELVTSGTTDAISLNVTNINSGFNSPIDHIVKVVSGTWKFGIGSIPGTAHQYTTTEGNNIAIIHCYPGQLYGQAAADTDTLVIT